MFTMLGYTRQPLIFQFISRASKKRLSTDSILIFNKHFFIRQELEACTTRKNRKVEKEGKKQMKNFKLLIGILRTFE